MTWAVLTGRVYVVAWPSPKAVLRVESGRPEEEASYRETESDLRDEQGQMRTLSRRRSTLEDDSKPSDEGQGPSGIQRAGSGKVLPRVSPALDVCDVLGGVPEGGLS